VQTPHTPRQMQHEQDKTPSLPAYGSKKSLEPLSSRKTPRLPVRDDTDPALKDYPGRFSVFICPAAHSNIEH
jgi:hypothetical protein